MAALNIHDLNNGKKDLDHIAEVATSNAPTTVDRLGNTKRTIAGLISSAASAVQATADGLLGSLVAKIEAAANTVLSSLGYAPPVDYVAGIKLTTRTQTVEYGGHVYAPKAAELPFTTSGTFEVAKFRLIEGVVGADLAGSSGASLVGNGGETVAESLDALQLPDYAALRAYRGPRKSVYVAGVGIADMFVRRPAGGAAAIDNGGTVIVGQFAWDRAAGDHISGAWFGYIQGVIAAAIASGKKAVLPAGTYVVDTADALATAGRLSLSGSGDVTIIVKKAFKLTGLTKLTLQNIKFDFSQQALGYWNALDIISCSNVRIYDCEGVDSVRTMFSLTNCDGFDIARVVARRAGREQTTGGTGVHIGNSISIYQCSNGRVRNCESYTPWQLHYFIWSEDSAKPSQNVRLLHCQGDGALDNGIRFQPLYTDPSTVRDCSAEYCRVTGSAGDNYRLNGVRNKLVRCESEAAAGFGFKIEFGKNLDVLGFTDSGSSTNGLRVNTAPAGVDGITISNSVSRGSVGVLGGFTMACIAPENGVGAYTIANITYDGCEVYDSSRKGFTASGRNTATDDTPIDGLTIRNCKVRRTNVGGAIGVAGNAYELAYVSGFEFVGNSSKEVNGSYHLVMSSVENGAVRANRFLPGAVSAASGTIRIEDVANSLPLVSNNLEVRDNDLTGTTAATEIVKPSTGTNIIIGDNMEKAGFAPMPRRVRTMSASGSLTRGDAIVFIAGAVTTTLPAANSYGAAHGGQITVKNSDAVPRTLAAPAGSTIDGGVSISIPASGRVIVVSDGISAWYSA